MQNINYDLIKLLHCKLDSAWRLEKYYIQDAKDVNCHSVAALEKMLEDDRKHIEMLVKEIKMRMDDNAFN